MSSSGRERTKRKAWIKQGRNRFARLAGTGNEWPCCPSFGALKAVKPFSAPHGSWERMIAAPRRNDRFPGFAGDAMLRHCQSAFRPSRRRRRGRPLPAAQHPRDATLQHCSKAAVRKFPQRNSDSCSSNRRVGSLRQGEAWCAAHGYRLVDTFDDADVSATNDYRPEFQRKCREW